jgi:hypothetical protein
MMRLQVIFSKPNMNALSNTHTGLDDFTMVKNVIDIRTSDRFDSPISNAVTKPHGMDTPKYVLHVISFTSPPPKAMGNIDDRE